MRKNSREKMSSTHNFRTALRTICTLQHKWRCLIFSEGFEAGEDYVDTFKVTVYTAQIYAIFPSL